jgi:hypothetical protein
VIIVASDDRDALENEVDFFTLEPTSNGFKIVHTQSGEARRSDVVPKGVVHSIKSDSGFLKAVLITMPPRNADDVHFMN